MAGVTLIDLNGKAYTSDTNFSDRVYFSEAKKGNFYITEPFVSKLDGKNVILVAAPIWKDGIPNTEVVAVATIQPADGLLNNIMTSLKISENSIA